MSRWICSRGSGLTFVLMLAVAAGSGLAQAPSGGKDVLAGLPAYVPSAQVSETIRVAGSPQMGDLLHLFEAGFRSVQPNVRFEESLKSTVTAVSSVSSGNAEMGLVGREVWPQEIEAFEKAKGHAPLAIEVATGSYDVPKATFALMVFVNASNPLAALSREQLGRVFGARAAVETWGDLGLGGTWRARPIHLYGFSTANDKSLIFARTVFGPGDGWNRGLHEFSNTAGAHPVDAGEAIVRAVAADPDGIGISNVHYATAGVRVVALSGDDGRAVMPSRASVQSREYLLARSVSIVIDPGATDAGSVAAREFLRFILSRDGQRAVVREGNYLPLTSTVVKQQRRLLGP